MNEKRAREILSAPETIPVTYQNIPIWIDSIGENGQVKIQDLNSQISMEVPVADLAEVEGIPNTAPLM